MAQSTHEPVGYLFVTVVKYYALLLTINAGLYGPSAQLVCIYQHHHKHESNELFHRVLGALSRQWEFLNHLKYYGTMVVYRLHLA